MSQKPFQVPIVKTKIDYERSPAIGSLDREGREYRRRWVRDHYEPITDTVFNWVDAYEFDAVLRFYEYSRGGHSVYVTWEDRDKTGVRYPMHISDMVDVMGHVQNGYLSGKFGFSKKGTAYGIKLLEAIDEPSQDPYDDGPMMAQIVSHLPVGWGLHFDRQPNHHVVAVYTPKHFSAPAIRVEVDEEEEMAEALERMGNYVLEGKRQNG